MLGTVSITRGEEVHRTLEFSTMEELVRSVKAGDLAVQDGDLVETREVTIQGHVLVSKFLVRVDRDASIHLRALGDELVTKERS